MNSPGNVKIRCAVPTCGNIYYTDLKDENYRNKLFFLFPKNDVEKRHHWFQIMEMPFTTERIYICQDHFEEKSFTNTFKNRLSKFANPVKRVSENKVNILSNILLKPSVSKNESCEVGMPLTPSLSPFMPIYQNDVSVQQKFTNVQKKRGILSQIGESRVNKLTPRKKKLYYINRNQRTEITSLKRNLLKAKSKIKFAQKLCYSKFFERLERNLDPAGVEFIKGCFENVNYKRPIWSTKHKIFSLALYRRGPKCYNFLRRCIPLPSKTTLRKLLDGTNFEPGINKIIFSRLSKRVSKIDEIDKCCLVMFDEISLSEKLVYDIKTDKIVGFVDLGISLGRKNEAADHALVFMVSGLKRQWKQPVAYYFTKGTIKTVHLKLLIKEVISALQETGLHVMATVCDQGATNRAAIRDLSADKNIVKKGPYFVVNNKKVFTIFDPPHLLKSTRNAFFNIIFAFPNIK